LIVVIDKVLSEEECNQTINLYKEFQHNAHEWRGTKPLDFEFVSKKFKNLIINKIELITNSIFKDVVYDWGEIVKWHPSNYQSLHLDTYSDKTILSSITYLSEDFTGGETYFEDGTIIKPVTGRTLIFNGMQYVHGVKKVSDGIRWTVPIWYKKRGE
jgi:hypothetical protein